VAWFVRAVTFVRRQVIIRDTQFREVLGRDGSHDRIVFGVGEGCRDDGVLAAGEDVDGGRLVFFHHDLQDAPVVQGDGKEV
jgi:hypothetical protein